MTEETGTGRLREPVASRPSMPGYSLAPADGGRGLLPWSWATERLAGARNYFVATTRPGGLPHLMPVWGVWLDDAFYFSTGRASRKARNLKANQHCVVSPERGDEAVIVEGVAEELGGGPPWRRFVAAYKAKYDWEITGEEGPVFVVRPRVVFGFVEAADQFTSTATRWRLADG